MSDIIKICRKKVLESGRYGLEEKMTDKEKKKCNAIIHSASVSSGMVGAGLAQVPMSDNFIITPIQIGMTIALGKVFGIEIDKSASKAMVVSQVAAITGRSASQLIAGWIPGVGNSINAATAASLTETIGWIIAKEFEKKRDKMYKEEK